MKGQRKDYSLHVYLLQQCQRFKRREEGRKQQKALCEINSYLVIVPPPVDLHHRDPGDAAGPWTSEAAELWHAHRGAVPSQHGDARGAGGRRRLRGDPGGHPRRVLQVRQCPLYRDPPTRRWRGSPRLWKSEHHYLFKNLYLHKMSLKQNNCSSHQLQSTGGWFVPSDRGWQ